MTNPIGKMTPQEFLAKESRFVREWQRAKIGTHAERLALERLNTHRALGPQIIQHTLEQCDRAADILTELGVLLSELDTEWLPLSELMKMETILRLRQAAHASLPRSEELTVVPPNNPNQSYLRS